MWFRRDLRIASNPALASASREAQLRGSSVIALFVLDPRLQATSGPNRLAFLYEALRSLRESGVPLVIRSGDPAREIAAIAHESAADLVVCTKDFTPYGRARDQRVSDTLRSVGVTLAQQGSPYVVPPGTVLKDDGSPFKVFTPFRRVWERHVFAGIHNSRPAVGDASDVRWMEQDSLEVPASPTEGSVFLPRASEDAAWRRLEHFVEHNLRTYDVARNYPSQDSTSYLSAYLKFGLLHPAQILPVVANGEVGGEVFRAELGWREFYADVLWHRPETVTNAFAPAMESIEVDEGEVADEHFAAWCHGRTGYPFVDAGMRQLQRDGWMHNRVRMVVASFLVKDLHLDWRRGAAWFMQHLVDGDIASNQHGWQWTAGTGTDASPYYRVFNPVMQGKKFDENGDYIRRYVPELAQLTGREVHEPWSLNGGGLFGGVDGYPARIVDHATERSEALARYGAVKDSVARA